MKKKIGPLPMWSWIVIVGGTIGLYLLYKNRSSSTATTTTGTTDTPVLAATGAAPTDPSSGGGGGTTGATTDNTGIFTALSNLADQVNTLGSQISSQSPLPGAGGVSDHTAPGSTIVGEIADITGAATALHTAFPGMFATPTTGGGGGKKPTLPKLDKGGIRLPSGAKPPTAPKGYTIKGLGNGNWEAIPNATKHTSAGSGNAGNAGHTGKTKTSGATTHQSTGHTGKTKTPPKKTTVSGHKR